MLEVFLIKAMKKAALRNGRIPVFDPRLAYTLACLGRDIYDEEASAFLERGVPCSTPRVIKPTLNTR
jgi:hypothetical protein